MYSARMGPYRQSAADRASLEDAYDRQLASARDTFSGQWEIVEALGGLVAVPHGTEVVPAMNLDALVRKLRERGHA